MVETETPGGLVLRVARSAGDWDLRGLGNAAEIHYHKLWRAERGLSRLTREEARRLGEVLFLGARRK
jgi:hypothetical protein